MSKTDSEVVETIIGAISDVAKDRDDVAIIAPMSISDFVLFLKMLSEFSEKNQPELTKDS